MGELDMLMKYYPVSRLICHVLSDEDLIEFSRYASLTGYGTENGAYSGHASLVAACNYVHFKSGIDCALECMHKILGYGFNLAVNSVVLKNK